MTGTLRCFTRILSLRLLTGRARSGRWVKVVATFGTNLDVE